MLAEDIVIGDEYLLREPPRPGAEIQHVKVLEKVRTGRWRVEWLDPNPGLVDYVKSANLIVPWNQRARYLRDERHREQLAALPQRHDDGRDGPVADAVEQVLEATGEQLSAFKGVLDYASRRWPVCANAPGSRYRRTHSATPIAPTSRTSLRLRVRRCPSVRRRRARHRALAR